MGSYDKCKCGNMKTLEAMQCAGCAQKQNAEAKKKRIKAEHAAKARIIKETREAAARLAADQETREDTLARENIELRAEVKRSASVIKTFQDRTSFEDRLLGEVIETIERSPYKPILRKPPQTSPSPKDHEMLMNVSDAHYPEVVDPESAMGLDYGPDVCRRRLEYLRDKVIRYGDLRRTSYPIRKLTVAVNGDMLGGDIHEELARTNARPSSQALVDMAYMLFDMGLSFAGAFPEVEFIVMPGNHPRLRHKPYHKEKWDNWEWVMGKFLEALAGDKFSVTVPKQLVHMFNVFQWRLGVTHGDGVKAASFAGIPFYAFKQRRDALQALLKTLGNPQLDMLIYGHFHQLIFEEGQGCSLLVNGSIKGGDEYILNTKYQAQAPIQALLTYHPKYGMTDLSRINLGHVA